MRWVVMRVQKGEILYKGDSVFLSEDSAKRFRDDAAYRLRHDRSIISKNEVAHARFWVARPVEDSNEFGPVSP